MTETLGDMGTTHTITHTMMFRFPAGVRRVPTRGPARSKPGGFPAGPSGFPAAPGGFPGGPGEVSLRHEVHCFQGHLDSASGIGFLC
jgi:hypothetical protein